MSSYKECGFLHQSAYHMFQFLLTNAEIATSPLLLPPLARLYIAHYKPALDYARVQKHFANIRVRLDRFNCFDRRKLTLNQKIRLFFALSATIDQTMEDALKENGKYELDETRKLIKYKSNDCSLHLEGSQCRKERVSPTRETTVFGDFGSPDDIKEDEGSDSEDNKNYNPVTPMDITKGTDKKRCMSFSNNAFDNGGTVPKRPKSSSFQRTPSTSSARAQKPSTSSTTSLLSNQPDAEMGSNCATNQTVLNNQQLLTPKREHVENGDVQGSFVEQNTGIAPYKNENVATVGLSTVLRSFESLVDTLEEPLLNQFQAKVIAKNELIATRNKMIPVTTLETALRSILNLVTRPLSEVTHGDSSRSLKDFLLVLLTLTNMYKYEELDGLKDELKYVKTGTVIRDMMIPADRIPDSLNYALSLLL